MPRSNLTRFGNKSNPQIILEFFIYKVNLFIRILLIEPDDLVKEPVSPIKHVSRHSENLLSSPLTILSLLFFRHQLEYSNLGWLNLVSELVDEAWTKEVKEVFLLGFFSYIFGVVPNKVWHDQFFNYRVHLLHPVIFELSQIISVLRLCHHHPFVIILASIVHEWWEIQSPEQNDHIETGLHYKEHEWGPVMLPHFVKILKVSRERPLDKVGNTESRGREPWGGDSSVLEKGLVLFENGSREIECERGQVGAGTSHMGLINRGKVAAVSWPIAGRQVPIDTIQTACCQHQFSLDSLCILVGWEHIIDFNKLCKVSVVRNREEKLDRLS